MVYNPYTIQNSATLAFNKELKQNLYEPKLGLYRGKSIMIVSYKTIRWSDTLPAIYLKIKSIFFYCLGFLDMDQAKIKVRKEEVKTYHYKSCKKKRDLKFDRKWNEQQNSIKKTSKVMDFKEIDNYIEKIDELKSKNNEVLEELKKVTKRNAELEELIKLFRETEEISNTIENFKRQIGLPKKTT